MPPRLAAGGAASYQYFRFEQDGAIRAGFVFLNMGGELAGIAAADIALAKAAQAILLWGPAAFATRSPLARAGDAVILRPEIASVHDPAMPAASADPAQALRLAARIGG